jgi:hypothetical protein
MGVSLDGLAGDCPLIFVVTILYRSIFQFILNIWASAISVTFLTIKIHEKIRTILNEFAPNQPRPCVEMNAICCHESPKQRPVISPYAFVTSSLVPNSISCGFGGVSGRRSLVFGLVPPTCNSGGG